MQTPSAEVGANIRAEIARRGIHQTDLAAQLGISQSALSKRLRGTTPLDINEVADIAAALGVPLSTLLPSEPLAS